MCLPRTRARLRRGKEEMAGREKGKVEAKKRWRGREICGGGEGEVGEKGATAKGREESGNEAGWVVVWVGGNERLREGGEGGWERN